MSQFGFLDKKNGCKKFSLAPGAFFFVRVLTGVKYKE